MEFDTDKDKLIIDKIKKIILIFTSVIMLSGCKNDAQIKEESQVDIFATVKTEEVKVEGSQHDDSVMDVPFIIQTDSLIAVTGIVQTTGIDDNYKLKIRAKYQILSSKRDFYLISDSDLSEYWGRCVEVKGNFPLGWDMKTEKMEGNWTWGRSAIAVKSISLVPGNNCDILNKQKTLSKTSKYLRTLDYTDTLRGYISRHQRSSPDIAMDYEMILDKPVQNPEDDFIFLDRIIIYPDINLSSLNKLIDNKNHCTAYGWVIGGYAESVVFETDSITQARGF